MSHAFTNCLDEFQRKGQPLFYSNFLAPQLPAFPCKIGPTEFIVLQCTASDTELEKISNTDSMNSTRVVVVID